MTPRLVALDVDGTIVHHEEGARPPGGPGDGLPSARILEAVRALAAAGVGVVLASGRMYPGTRRVHEYLGLGTPLICQQGAAVHAPSGAVLHEFPIALEVAHAVVALARQLGHPYEWFTPLRYLASIQNDPSDIYAALSGVPVEYHPTPEHSGLAPTGVGIISNANDARAVHAELVTTLGDAAHVIDFSGVTVCVAPHATKGRTLALLAADLDLPREQVVAVGDSVNDASMLEWAGRGYAPARSDAYAVAAADVVLEAPGDRAVADLLERIARGQAV